MTIDNDLILRDGETREQYIVRVASQREKYGYTWDEVAEIINSQLGLNYGECTYRKTYAAFKKLTDAMGGTNDERLLREIRDERRELYKERTKLRDERNEYNAMLRSQARYENAIDSFSQVIKEHVPAIYEKTQHSSFGNESELIAMISDMHCGMECNNAYTQMRGNWLWHLLDNYLEQVIRIGRSHAARAIHILLGGDLVSGVIHTSLRIEAGRNVIEQVMEASDMIAGFVAACARVFDNVYVHYVGGNHGRVVPGKDDALRGENFDVLIPHYVAAACAELKNVEIIKPLDTTLDVFSALGRKCALVHGNNDKSSTVSDDLMPITGELDYIFMGHTHTTAMVPTRSACRVIVNGSFVATDGYAFDHRYFSRPEQCVMVLSKEGPDCLYRCVLNGGEKDESI